MKVLTLPLGIMQTNCHICINEAERQAVIIDPGDEGSRVADTLNQESVVPVAILLTHGHFDHIRAVEGLRRRYQIPVVAGRSEEEILTNIELNLSAKVPPAVTVTADRLCVGSEVLDYAGLHFTVMETPGHTIGGVCYYLSEQAAVFSGDVLFYESIGNTAFPTGNHRQLLQSIREKLLTLPEETVCYCGHGQSTDIKHEKYFNPWVSL
ncbi:MAG: MBL fold metallo-hydrolase [Lachnospiraceae bacterium]|nr:MBL fold metallo-hydrolase [Lachnospiraceae bacterium]MDY5742255.1 MBL fold metallo-hydrolase [Lachnospiraceae bacterium]